MRRRTAIVFVGLIVIASALVVMAKQQSTPEDPVARSVPSDGRNAINPPLTPMMKDIHAVLDAERDALASLDARLRLAATETEVMSVMREIERVKVESELQILGVQADYARREGRVEQAKQIEAEIRLMRTRSLQTEQQPRLRADAAPPIH